MSALARGTVKLEPFNSQWAYAFAKEASAIKDKLGPDNIKDIQHVGSTSISGILSKPIIDIAIPVDNLDIADRWQQSLAELGYWYKGKQSDMPDRRFFAKGPDDDRTVYLHIVTKEEFNRLIKFRDTLRNNKDLANEYSVLKQELAKKYSKDRESYTKAKDEFIQEIINS